MPDWPTPASTVIPAPVMLSLMGSLQRTLADGVTLVNVASVINQNTVYAFPFEVAQSVTVAKLWYSCGAAAGNVDMGIYDESYVRKVSKGSTAAGAGAGGVTELDIADTILSPGRYYCAFVTDSATCTFQVTANKAGTWIAGTLPFKVAGCLQKAAGFPLPDPLAPAVVSNTVWPLFGLALRTLVQ